MNLGKTHFQRQRCYWITFKTNSNSEKFINRIKQHKINGYFREGSYVNEIFCDGRRVLFPKINFTRNCFWIYNAVISDVKKYLETCQPKSEKPCAAVLWNKQMRDFNGKITATDIDCAYWRIAFLKKYIGQKTYIKGLEIEDKSMRNSSISNLHSHKQWYIIKNGEITKKNFFITKPDSYSIIYDDIRYSCYKLMKDLSLLLGNDFICYKVDCIYYVDSKKNRKLVQDFLDDKNMDWKQLEEPHIKKNHKKQKHENTDVIN
jgi:hypothetical protein